MHGPLSKHPDLGPAILCPRVWPLPPRCLPFECPPVGGARAWESGLQRSPQAISTPPLAEGSPLSEAGDPHTHSRRSLHQPQACNTNGESVKPKIPL